MSTIDLSNLDSESIALLYLAGELPAEQRAQVEQMLSRDLVLRGVVERLRTTHETIGGALTRADSARPLAISESAARRRVGRAMAEWRVSWLSRPAQRDKRQFHWRSLVPPAIAAGIVITIGMLIWWSSVGDGTNLRSNSSQVADADTGGEGLSVADSEAPIADDVVATILFVNTPDDGELASAEQDMSALRFLSERAQENGASQ